MNCRKCGACCIAPSISSPIPGMPDGKPAGIRCVNLNENNECTIFDSPERPKVCGDYQADVIFCGSNFSDAMNILSDLLK